MPAKPPSPWQLRKHPKSRYWRVRFSHEGIRYEESTGQSDFGKAEECAARFYAKVVSGQHRPPVRIIGDAASPLDAIGAEWLADIEYTGDPWVIYLRHWCRHFKTLGGLCEPGAIARYWEHRLTIVKRVSVNKEVGPLRDLLIWCHERELVSAPVEVPGLPPKTRKKNQGKPYHLRRRGKATEVTAEQARAVIAELPEWSTSKRSRFPIRARFVFALETGLRPKTLDQLSVPRHYQRGAAELFITEDIDKNKFERRVPLSKVAREAIDSVCPARGLIFGEHDYRDALEKAARKVLPPHLAETFCSYDFRHRAATEFAATGDLTGAAFLLGHLQVTTINKYAKPEAQAASRVLEKTRELTGSDAADDVTPPVVAALPSPAPRAAPALVGVPAWGTVSDSAFSAKRGVADLPMISKLCEGEDSNLHGSYPASTSIQGKREIIDDFGASENAQTPLKASGGISVGLVPQPLALHPGLLAGAIRILSANALGEPVSPDEARALARAALSTTELGRLALEVLDGGPRALAAAAQLASALSLAAVAGAGTKTGSGT